MMKATVLELTDLPEQVLKFLRDIDFSVDFQALQDDTYILHGKIGRDKKCTLWPVKIVDGRLWLMYDDKSDGTEKYAKNLSDYVHAELGGWHEQA